MSTKIYCDSADIQIIKRYNKKKNCKRFYNQSKFNEKSWRKRLQDIFTKNSQN